MDEACQISASQASALPYPILGAAVLTKPAPQTKRNTNPLLCPQPNRHPGPSAMSWKKKGGEGEGALEEGTPKALEENHCCYFLEPWTGQSCCSSKPMSLAEPAANRKEKCLVSSESLYEDEEFVQRQLLALVAPKVFFYLAELNGALSYALGAGPLFDVSDDSDSTQTLLAKALDEYADIQSRATGEEKTMYSGCRLLWKGCWTSMIVSSWSIVSWFVRNAALSSHVHGCLPSAFLMENINRPWVCLLGAGDWLNWREQYVSHREYRLETS